MKHVKLFENIFNTPQMGGILTNWKSSDKSKYEVGGSIGERKWMSEPIIPNGIDYLSKNSNCEIFTDKKSYEDFLNTQHYFSAGHSHCFYDEKQHEYFSANGSKYNDPDAEKSDMMFEVGHELVAVWDEKNSIGYVLPKSKMKL